MPLHRRPERSLHYFFSSSPQWIYPVSEAPYYPTGAKVSMAASVILFTFPWVLDYMMQRANKQREKKLAELPADHVFPEGPVGHMDGKLTAPLASERNIQLTGTPPAYSPIQIRALVRRDGSKRLWERDFEYFSRLDPISLLRRLNE